MKANPGGRIAPSDVVGRDKLIAQLWDILERQSVVLTSERRIGKTQMVKKMKAEASEDVLAIFRDLESVRTPLEFVELVFRDVEEFLSRKARTASRTRQLLQQLAGTKVGGVVKFPKSVAPHWKTLLERTIEDLVEHQERPIVFFWDEVPYMLFNIKRGDGGEEGAMEVLDLLRQLRQTHDRLRMVFTGSIGLHNVVTSLKAAGYAGDPTNDMRTINVPPLAPLDAEALALHLLEGEKIETENPEEIAQAIATAVDNIPYYIHHVVEELKFHIGDVNASVAGEMVDRRLRDPLDKWHLQHYRERIDTYYTPGQRRLALALLDILAADGPLTFDKLFNLIKSRMEIADEEVEKVRRMLTLLQRDHYIELETDKTYRFRFPLIRRWWHLNRG